MILINGRLIPQSEASVSIDNRGLNYGDALFETVKVANGRLLFWEDHYFRLMASMRILRMEIPMNFTLEFLEEEIVRTLETSSLTNARVKLLVWRNAGGKYQPLERTISYAIISEPLDFLYPQSDSLCEVEIFKDYYINSGLLSTLKTTNKLVNVLGSIFALENDIDNCILLNEKKMVVEVLNGNLFLVKDGHIKTPPLVDGCLNGIMRKQLLRKLKENSTYTIEENSISPFDLQKADELFITNTVVGIKPITKYRKKSFQKVISNNLLQMLNEELKHEKVQL